MKLIFKMAFRNLVRNARRTRITIASIAFGLAVVLWLQGILSGGVETNIRKITSTLIGRVQIYHPRYLEVRNLKWFIPGDAETLLTRVSEALRAPELRSVNFSPRVNLPVLVSSGEESMSAMLVGVDPEREPTVSLLHTYPRSGDFLSGPAHRQCEQAPIFIGRALAELLGVSVGSKLVLMSQAVDGTLGNELFLVQGIYESGSRDFDRLQLFTTVACAEKLAALPGIHEVVFNFGDDRLEAPLVARLKNAVGDGLQVTTWREALPRMNNMVSFNQAMVAVVSSLLFVIISLGIVNTFLVSVFERTREFGVMISLGTPPSRVVLVILAECLAVGFFASLIGAAVAGAALVYHSMHGFDLGIVVPKGMAINQFVLDSLVYPVIEPWRIAKTIGLTVVSVCLAGVYPAYRASRLQPVEAMRTH